MTVAVDGAQRYVWPVSTGRPGYDTPNGTYKPNRMDADHYSQEWDNAPMPHTIFFDLHGHAIHGFFDVKHLGLPVSHGCVRLAPANATILFDLVKAGGMANTSVIVAGRTPGAAVARMPARSSSRRRRRQRFPQPPLRAGMPDRAAKNGSRSSRAPPGYGQPRLWPAGLRPAYYGQSYYRSLITGSRTTDSRFTSSGRILSSRSRRIEGRSTRAQFALAYAARNGIACRSRCYFGIGHLFLGRTHQ